MKKNKLIVLSLIIAVVFVAIGCTAQPDTLDRTQTRIGMDNRNNALRRNNNLTRRDDLGLNDNMDMNNNLLGREDTIERNRLRNNIANDNGLNNNNVNNNGVNNNGVNNNSMNNNGNNRKTAKKIADRIEEIQGIDDAYVLISGDTAIVGVDMDNEAQGQITRDLKQRIERTVKNVDNDIKNVSITADPDLLTRIRNMFKDMDEGNPVEGFVDQFEEILRRITPVR